MRQRPSVVNRPCLFFVLGAVLLWAQYEYVARHGEFYPSLTLPAGGATIRDGETWNRARWLAIAVTRDGERVQVNEHELLSMIPAQYRTRVLANGFGLRPEAGASEPLVDEARRWLRTRLADQLGRSDVTAIEIVMAQYTSSRQPPPHPYRPTSSFRIPL